MTPPTQATNLLGDLNERQREAVLSTEGPLLVLAGAGTGKTRVITHRVAHLIANGVPAGAILAVTFTNKAADVMRERTSDLLRSAASDASQVWISTFHSFCARLLRREAPRIGLSRDFAIYDDDDQVSAIKRALLALDLPSDDYPPRGIRAQISRAKNHGITPDEMEEEAVKSRNDVRANVANVFRLYNQMLRKAEAVDFDDLLLRGVELLRADSEARAAWSSRFAYIMVDEFQDTNRWQEELVRLLAGTRQNVCVVGDEDQSIYGWRGAQSGNLHRFLEDFPNAKIIRLEENYRSTQIILDAASAVVENNSERLGKTLRGTVGAGVPLRFFEAHDSSAEAEFVGGEIASLARSDPSQHVAVLYRTGAQSRSFEEVLRRLGIRHRVIGGFSFYARAEVRTALGFVRLLLHPEDDVSLLRVLNVPPRGIGAATVAALEARSRETGQSLWEVIRSGEAGAARKLGTLDSFRELIESLREESRDLGPTQLVERVLHRTGYLDWIEQQDNLEHTSRAENLRELENAVAEATQQGLGLEEVLDHAALVSDADDYDEGATVSLMTLHSAKGLEFNTVFLAGLEEGLLPHSRSGDTSAAIEEERRLFYVGMTRAKHSLVLSRARYRRIYGEERLRGSLPSRFLTEIPGELVEVASGSLSEPGQTRRYESDPEYSQDDLYRRRSQRRPAYGRPAPRAPRSADPLVGTRVRHRKYGVGTIIEVEGDGDDRKLTVSFQDYGAKKLVERYANLELA
ncbi:MAG TPA: UvrD-helicase domain-containing protein [Candidatus Cybelea sp.]|nr:UvrD-helicase domain-containing protein [Candidatus Cybelea sp.]